MSDEPKPDLSDLSDLLETVFKAQSMKRRVEVAALGLEAMVKNADDVKIKRVLTRVIEVMEEEKMGLADSSMLSAFLVDSICQASVAPEHHRDMMMLTIKRLGNAGPTPEQEKED